MRHLGAVTKDELLFERLTESIIGAFYEVYNRLGYGFLEKVYVRALEIELRHRGHEVRREVRVDIYYRDRFICSQRIDLLVVDSVIVEVKAWDTMPPAAIKQCRSYLRALGKEVGLVFNFGIKPQLKRIIHVGGPLGSDVEVRLPKVAGPDPGLGRWAEG
jgi:GxxExxY protein